MKDHVKGGLEYAVISLLVAGLCLWQVITQSQAEEPSPAHLAVLGLGLVVAVAMHIVFMMQLVRRTGRPFWPWLIRSTNRAAHGL